MTGFFLLSLTITVIIPSALGRLGFDGVGTLTTDTFNCLGRNGYNFFIGRVWRSLGAYDDGGAQNMKNAKAGRA